MVPVLPAAGNLKPNERALAAVPLVNTSPSLRSHPGRTGVDRLRSDMRRKINRFVLLIVDALDDVCLLAHSGVGKHSVSGSQIFQIALERTDVAGGPMRNILSNAKIVRDFLHRIKSGELPNAHAHRVARMNETVGARHDPAIRAVGICRRPISGAVDFTGLNRTVADRCPRQ